MKKSSFQIIFLADRSLFCKRWLKHIAKRQLKIVEISIILDNVHISRTRTLYHDSRLIWL